MTLDTIAAPAEKLPRAPDTRQPRLGFLGVGWIGLNRLEALASSGVAQIAAVADPNSEMAARAKTIAPGALVLNSLGELLDTGVDGIVIATPSALHAEQASAALDRGIAVFCQKPLGRNAAETRAVVANAAKANRLLGVDLSYRCLTAARRIRELISAGELGAIYAVELAFHNAYGPDKPWFYDRDLSGGGCVVDLGIHLVDLALWSLGFPKVQNVFSRLYAAGERWSARNSKVEDYASAHLDLDSGAIVQLACSWKLPAGRDAIIQAAFYGTGGGAALRNVNGSFYDFVGERYSGTRCEVLTSGPEPWGGEALIGWTKQLAISSVFDPAIEQLVAVAEALDAIYAQGTGS